MAKIIYALLMVFLVEFALWVFGGASYSQTSIFSLVNNPTGILTNPLYLAIVVAIGIFAGSQIIPLNAWQINVYGVYAAIAAIFLTFVMSIVHLYSFVYSELAAYTATFTIPLTMLIMAPFLITYLLTVVEWVRNN